MLSAFTLLTHKISSRSIESMLSPRYNTAHPETRVQNQPSVRTVPSLNAWAVMPFSSELFKRNFVSISSASS